ncbi:hypothetical protein [Haloarchaeobius amylolyticus]|uniref:hypothetical protein n=1 Tax=Haloarchaeobius amylolyticus TaxID=1198296 RepID=UPI00226D73DD|nr:hypothetical protein [Haloarchaeobius amylolyticus]
MNTSAHRPVLPSVALAGLVLFVGSLGARVTQSLVLGLGLSPDMVFTGFGTNTVLTLALFCLVGGLLSRPPSSGAVSSPANRLFLVGASLVVLAAVITITLQSAPTVGLATLAWIYGPTVVTALGVFVVLTRCLAGRPDLASDRDGGLWERVGVSSTTEPAKEGYLPFDAGPLGDIAYVAVAVAVVQLLLGVFGWPSLSVLGGDLWKVGWASFALVAGPTGALLVALGVVFRREFSVPTVVVAAGALTVVVGSLGASLLVVDPGKYEVVLANTVGQLRWVGRFVAAVVLFRAVFGLRAAVAPTNRDTPSRQATDSW